MVCVLQNIRVPTVHIHATLFTEVSNVSYITTSNKNI